MTTKETKMAFMNRNLSVIAYNNGFTMWHYNTQDDLVSILTDDTYFKNIWALGARGDVMYITSKGETTICQITEIGNEKVKVSRMSVQ